MTEKPILEVCLSPVLLHLYDLEDTIVVVIDIFRATSTMCAALDNGAKEVIPIAAVEECLEYTKKEGDYIVAGERDGKILDGLTHGNSPSEYSRELIEGKSLVMTTTNGTKLLNKAKSAHTIVIGSFLNLDSVCSYLLEKNQKVLLACSGWKDRVNTEDTLFAGAVIDQVKDHFDIQCDTAQIALSLYETSEKYPHLIDFLKQSSHYKRLSKFGLQKEMEYCATRNLHPVLPIFNGYSITCEPK